jgi:hypothetical protein
MTGPLLLKDVRRPMPDESVPKALAKVRIDTVELSRLVGGEQHQHSWSEAGRS